MEAKSNWPGGRSGSLPTRATKIPTIVGVTGHRNLRQEDIFRLEEKVRNLFQKLKWDYPHTPLVVISALAEGADRLVARVGLEENAGFIAILPMPQAEYEKDFSGDGSLSEFRQLLARASPVITVPLATKSQCDAASASERDCQYALASAWVVRHCHLLVALWDGQDPKLAAGTARTVSFMLNRVRSPYNQHVNEFLSGELGAVYWIVTPRDGKPAPAGALEARHLIGEWDWGEVVEGISDSPDIGPKNRKEALNDWRKRLRRLDDFNRDCGWFEKGLPFDDYGDLETLSKVPGGLSQAERSLAATYLSADGLAMKFQKSTMRTIVLLVAMVLAGFACLQLFLELVPQWYVLALYPLALALAAAIYFFVKRQNIHDSYLEFRTLAEGQRVQLFWTIAGIPEEAVEIHLGHYEGAAGWVTDAMRAWAAVHIQPVPEGTASQPGLADGRVHFTLQAWVKGQLAYFKNGKLREHKAHKLLGRWSFVVYSFSAIAALVWVLAYPKIEPESYWKHFLSLAIALGVSLSAAFEAISQKGAYAEHSKSYERMERIYARALKVGEAYIERNDIKGARRILRTLGEAALEENAHWLALHRSRPIDAPKG